MLTNQALFADALPLIIAMGPARAGTALSGFSQQFSSGKMSEGAMNLLAEMNIIIDKTKARKVGMGQFMLLPGAMRQGDVDMARDAPSTFVMDRLLPQIDKYLDKNFGKSFTGADERRKTQMEMAAFQQVASRIPGGMEMAETLRNNPLIFRDRAAQRAAMSRDAFQIQTANNPKVVVEGLNAALNGLMISLASPSMKTGTSALSDLTRGINWFSTELDKHPNAARYLIDFAAGLTAVAVAIAGAMLTIVPAVAAAKLLKYAAGPSKPGSGATAGAVAGVASRLAGIPLAAGIAAHEFDSDDASGKWIDKHIPGAAAIDSFFYRHTGGLVGRERDPPPTPVVVHLTTVNNNNVDGKTLTQTVTKQIVKGFSSNAGPTSGDMRSTPVPAGATASTQ